ncbi:MAG TPA: hypothetical protein VIM73_03220, partial [Polyangiaceae bacterium]
MMTTVPTMTPAAARRAEQVPNPEAAEEAEPAVLRRPRVLYRTPVVDPELAAQAPALAVSMP